MTQDILLTCCSLLWNCQQFIEEDFCVKIHLSHLHWSHTCVHGCKFICTGKESISQKLFVFLSSRSLFPPKKFNFSALLNPEIIPLPLWLWWFKLPCADVYQIIWHCIKVKWIVCITHNYHCNTLISSLSCLNLHHVIFGSWYVRRVTWSPNTFSILCRDVFCCEPSYRCSHLEGKANETSFTFLVDGLELIWQRMLLFQFHHVWCVGSQLLGIIGPVFGSATMEVFRRQHSNLAAGGGFHTPLLKVIATYFIKLPNMSN